MSAQPARRPRYMPDIRAGDLVLVPSQPFFVHAREQPCLPSCTIHDCICPRCCRLVDKENVSNATVAPHPSARCVFPCACCARFSCRYEPALCGCGAPLHPRRVRPHRLLARPQSGCIQTPHAANAHLGTGFAPPCAGAPGPEDTYILAYPLSWGDGVNITVCWAEQGDSQEGDRHV